MLFDIIVGNPPYTLPNNKNIFELFILIACNFSNKSIFVCPNSFFYLKHSILKEYLSHHLYNAFDIGKCFKELIKVSIILFSESIQSNQKFTVNVTLNNTICLRNVDGVFIGRGITTGCNTAFIIDKKTKDELCTQDIISNNLIRPLLKKSKVRKWNLLPIDEFLIVPKNINLENEYPVLYKYLFHYKYLLEKRYDKTTYWFGFRSCSYYEQFDSIKIIWEITSDKWRFAIDYNKHYLVSNRFFLTSSKISIFYLLGLLNSNLLHYCFIVNNGLFTSGGAYCLKEHSIGNLPIKIPTTIEQNKVCNLVTKILDIKKENPNSDVSEFEDQLNNIIYSLYNLTNDEIAIIENELSK